MEIQNLIKNIIWPSNKEINESTIDFIFRLSMTKRPTNEIFKKNYNITNIHEKSGLSEIISLWDELFENAQSDQLINVVEEWIEDMIFLKTLLEKSAKIYLITDNDLEHIPEQIRNKPFLGNIPGIHPERLEKNNFSNDLKIPELQNYLGREIKIIDSDFNNFITESKHMLEKHGSIIPKWLGIDKGYSVTPIKSVDDIKAYVNTDIYMFENLYNKQIAIQEFLNLGAEYRFFVVNGEIATWSLVNWDLTPLDSDQDLWSKDPHFDEIYKQVNKIIGDLSTSQSIITQDYVIDMSWDSKHNQPILIEMNPIHNSGLYGINISDYVDSIIANPNGFILK